jgi:nucleotidyltransferase/DNA polymerase involved in DNA repair
MYASVGQLDNPDLETTYGCGSNRGVVAAASYETRNMVAVRSKAVAL